MSVKLKIKTAWSITIKIECNGDTVMAILHNPLPGCGVKILDLLIRIWTTRKAEKMLSFKIRVTSAKNNHLGPIKF